jgi:hypothetical protein
VTKPGRPSSCSRGLSVGVDRPDWRLLGAKLARTDFASDSRCLIVRARARSSPRSRAAGTICGFLATAARCGRHHREGRALAGCGPAVATRRCAWDELCRQR